MKQFTRKVLLAASPVFGTSISIALLGAVHLPFPPELSAEALPQWAIFAAVVHSSTAFFLFISDRIFGSASSSASHAPNTGA